MDHEINIGDIFETTSGEWFRISNITNGYYYWRPLFSGKYTEWNKDLPPIKNYYKKQ